MRRTNTRTHFSRPFSLNTASAECNGTPLSGEIRSVRCIATTETTEKVNSLNTRGEKSRMKITMTLRWRKIENDTDTIEIINGRSCSHRNVSLVSVYRYIPVELHKNILLNNVTIRIRCFVSLSPSSCNHTAPIGTRRTLRCDSRTFPITSINST